MNKIEEVIYNLVRSNPTVKLAIRNFYQGCYDLLPKQKEFFKGEVSYKEGYYFGFHDVPEISADQTKVLVQKLSFDKRMPKVGEGESVGYLDLMDDKLGEFHKVDDTFAWNYHKGCRLQWYGDDTLIFNTAIDNNVVAELITVKSGEKRFLNYPIDTACKITGKATTFSYERLQLCMPGYGYPYKDNDSYLNQESPADTGLFLIDIVSGERKLIVNLKELAATAPEEFRTGYIHYVTHTEFSHDGRYISFLHRWIRKEGTNLKRWTRIMVYDTTNGNLIELPSQISGSHYVWNRKYQIIASCHINGKNCHVLFDMNHVNNYKIIAPEILNQDGHQSFIDDENFVTDTYPNKRRMAQLYKVNIPTGKVELIANTYSPKAFQSNQAIAHIACDLHPVVAFGKYVCFDCPRTGVRGLYLMKLD